MDDKIADGLAEIVSQLERADAMLEEEDREDALVEFVRGALGRARELLEGARRSVDDAFPIALDERTLIEALEALLEDYAEREEWEVDLTIDGAPEQLSEQLAAGMYLVAQKSLATIATFTDAHEVTVALTVEPETTRLVISDQGTGFDPASPGEASAGFSEVRDQAREIGGEFSLESSWSEGTAMVVEANNVIGH